MLIIVKLNFTNPKTIYSIMFRVTLIIVLFFHITLTYLTPSIARAEPAFTVRTVYFLPINTTSQQDMDTTIDALVKEAQQFYLDETQRHGSLPKTFKLETDNRGDIVVHRVKGRYSYQHYYQNRSSIVDEFPEKFRSQNNITLIFIEGGTFVRPEACGIGWNIVGTGINRGYALVPANGDCLSVSVIAHELGHAFGLGHNYSKPNYLMGSGNEHLAPCEIQWLDVHHYFNPNQVLNTAPTITQEYPIETVADDNVHFKIDASDRDGLVQAHFFIRTNGELIGCLSMAKQSETAEIVIPKSKIANEAEIYVQIIDTHGNYSRHATNIIEHEPGITYLSLLNGSQPVPNKIGLTPKNPKSQWTSWGQPRENRTNNGNRFVIDGMVFKRGISGVPFHDSDAIFVYDLTGGNYRQFHGYIGLADEHDHAIVRNANTSCGLGGSVYFTFNIDSRQAYKSKKLTGSDPPIKVKFDIPDNAETLEIRFNSAGDRKHCDTAVVADAKLLSMPSKIVEDPNTHPDVNNDGSVNITDLVIVASNFGATINGTIQPNPDVNRDGVVNKADLIIVADILTPASAPTLRPQYPETALRPNYPNPFNPETWIPYTLAAPANIEILIHSGEGRLVQRLDLGHQDAGNYENKHRAAYWDGRNAFGESVASGLYFYTLIAGDFTATRKMLIRK